MAGAMRGVQLQNRKISTDVMFMLDLKETMDQLAMVKCVLRSEDDHVLRREGGHALSRALDFEAIGQRKKWRLKRT